MLGFPFFLWKAGCPQSPSVLGRLGSDGALGPACPRAQCSGEFVKGYETVAAMTDAPNEMVLCLDLELKLVALEALCRASCRMVSWLANHCRLQRFRHFRIGRSAGSRKKMDDVRINND